MKHDRGPADAGNNLEHIKPTNTSRSFKRGGGVMRAAEKQHREAGVHHIGGGSGTQPKLNEDSDGSEIGY